MLVKLTPVCCFYDCGTLDDTEKESAVVIGVVLSVGVFISLISKFSHSLTINCVSIVLLKLFL